MATGSSHLGSSVLVLLCGLPAAGKTTLAKRLEASSSTSARVYERISFDDLYAEAAREAKDQPVEFDPRRWKACQLEMAQRVRSRVEQHSAQQTQQQLVLLVDDNFQYRSLRKRFWLLAAELDCGLGLIYMNVPTETCRERNASRRGQQQTSMRIPDEVLQRMADVFEPPDSHQNPWEHNILEVEPTGTSTILSENARLDEAMNVLIAQAGHDLSVRQAQQVETQRRLAQQGQDQEAVRTNVLHLVDLQLRQWISSQLRNDKKLPPNTSKAQLAAQLNRQRKEFLLEVKRSQRSMLLSCVLDDETRAPAEAEGAIDQVVVSLVRRFQEQQYCDAGGD